VNVFEPNIHRRDAEVAETAQRKLKLGHYSHPGFIYDSRAEDLLS